MTQSPVDPIPMLAGWMQVTQRVSVMTGAGSSTLSGAIPDDADDRPLIQIFGIIPKE